MKVKIFPLFILLAFFFSSCLKDTKLCSEEFAMVTVKFKTVDGYEVNVFDFKAVNKRTGQEYMHNSPNQPGTSQPDRAYIVVTDVDKNGISPNGDVIQVSARNPTNEQLINVEFVVSGGKEACHIEKKSGPVEVIIY